MTQEQATSESQSGRKKNLWILLALSFTIGILVLLGMAIFSKGGSALSIGQIPPDFTLQTYSGQTINTASLRGNIILINFWASWCTTCDEEAQMLQEAWSASQISEDGSVVFLGVAYTDTEPNALDFLETYGVTYPNGPDLRGEISKIFRVSSVPETFILDAEGVLRVVKIGPFTSTSEIYQAIEDAASGN